MAFKGKLWYSVMVAPNILAVIVVVRIYISQQKFYIMEKFNFYKFYVICIYQAC